VKVISVKCSLYLLCLKVSKLHCLSSYPTENSVCSLSKDQSVLCSEVITLYYQNDTDYMNTLCGQYAEFFSLNVKIWQYVILTMWL